MNKKTITFNWKIFFLLIQSLPTSALISQLTNPSLHLQILLCTFKSILIFCLYCELNLLLALKSINSFLLTLCERIYSSNLCTLRGYEGLLEPWSSSVNSLKPIAIKALKIVEPLLNEEVKENGCNWFLEPL